MELYHQIMLFRILFLFTFMSVWCCLPVQGEPGKCREGVTKDLTPHQLLKRDVFCSYDKDVRPVIQYSTNITVSVLMSVRFFSLDEINNMLLVNTWMALSWNDSHLVWNPTDYGNISILHVSSRDIWVPDLSIYNSANSDLSVSFKGTVCLVYPKGEVLCVPEVRWPVHCKPNLREWPYDLHECTMVFGSWSYAGEMVDIKLLDKGVSLVDFLGSREWELMNVTVVKQLKKYDCCPDQTYPMMEYTFIVKRHASGYLATVVIPSLILTVMTLSSFWLDANPPQRVGLCSMSILCHCLYLQYLGTKIPSNGDLTPVIVLFFRDSLIICGAALILSVILLKLSSQPACATGERETSPLWLSRILEMIQKQRVGQILCHGQFGSKVPLVKGDGANLIENGTEVNEEKNYVGKEWFILVTAIDRLAFFIFSVVYLVLLVALIPTN